MKKAIRIVSIVYLVYAIVACVALVLSIAFSNLIINLVVDEMIRQGGTGEVDPETIRIAATASTIVLLVVGLIISAGQIVLAVINKNSADRELSHGQRITLIAFDFFFELFPLFALQLIHLIKHWRRREKVVAEVK